MDRQTDKEPSKQHLDLEVMAPCESNIHCTCTCNSGGEAVP